MTDASSTAAGYAVLIEDDPNRTFTSLLKLYAPVAYGSKPFPQPESRRPYTQKTPCNLLRI